MLWGADQEEDVPEELEDLFFCRARRKRLDLDTCETEFMLVNAKEMRRSSCWHCPQGRRNRNRFAGKG